MKKNKNQKLVVDKQSISKLTNSEVTNVDGGRNTLVDPIITKTIVQSCFCPVLTVIRDVE